MKYEIIGGKYLHDDKQVAHLIVPCKPIKNEFAIGDILEVSPVNSTNKPLKNDMQKLSEHCQDCKEEFGHPDNCIGCDGSNLWGVDG